MALPLRRARARILPLVLALALAGCGGVPKGPLLPDQPIRSQVPEDVQARAASLVRLGDTALRSGDAATAVGLFDEATLTDSGNAVAAVGLGNALLAVGRALDATRAFERALTIEPRLSEARYGYARAMIAVGRPEIAAAQLRSVVEESPGDLAALNALGVALDLQGDHAAATEIYRRALAAMPAAVATRNNLALSLALQGQFAEAIEILRPLAEGPGATRRGRQNLALVYGLSGDMAAAERIGRIDLGGAELASNLAYFAAVRGIEDPALRAAALRPEPMTLVTEPRRPRASGSAAPGAAPAPPPLPPAAAPEPSAPPGAPTPLAPILGADGGPRAGDATWFVDLGRMQPAAAATAWRDLRTKHGPTLAGLERLAGAGAGSEPLLVGPIASEAVARTLCGQLEPDAPGCRPVQL